jgi:hypothetical protein
MEQALSTFTAMPATRQEQHNFAAKITTELLNGEYDIVKFWVQAKIIADTINEIMDSKQLKDIAIQQIGEDGQNMGGCKITVGNRRTFDFSKCDHFEWVELSNQITENKEKLKKIEALLKVLDKPIVDAETGAIINPPTVSVIEFPVVK